MCFERLEDRLLLAGDVTAVIRGGTLKITGDDQANVTAIDQTGLPADQIRITGTGTTINGGAGPVVLTGFTRDVRARMGEGDDTLSLTDVAVPRNLVAHDIQGDNRLDATTTTIGGRQVSSSKDGLGITQAITVTVGTHVRIHHRGGIAVMSLAGVDIGRNLRTVTAEYDDSIALGGTSTIGGSVNVNTKNGDGTVFLGATGAVTTVGNRVTVRGGSGSGNVALTDLTSTGATRVRTGNGSDSIRLTNVTSTAATRIRTGNGGDTVTVNGGTMDGLLNIDTGKDDDAVAINDFAGYTAVFRGNVDTRTSAGDDTVTLGVAAGTSPAQFDGRLLINGGAGTNTGTIHPGMDFNGGTVFRNIAMTS